VPFSARQPDGSILYGARDDDRDSRSGSRASISARHGTPASIVRLGLSGRTALLDKGDSSRQCGRAEVRASTDGHSISTGRQQNGVYVFNNPAERAANGRFAVSESEVSTVPFRSANDPAWSIRSSVGFDNVSPLSVLLNYSGPTSPVQVRGYVEARLIRAEAALHAAPGTSA